jgi:predicted ATPase
MRDLLAAKGYAAPEVGRAYTRAWTLCQQGGDMSQIVPIQYGLWVFHIAGAEYQTAYQLAAQLFSLAQGRQDPMPLLAALRELGGAALMLGQPVPARGHLEQALALYDPQRHGPLAFRYGHDVGTSVLARTLPFLHRIRVSGEREVDDDTDLLASIIRPRHH